MSARKARATRPRAKRPVALVTGGARRLGKQIALALAGAGYDVIISYNSSAAGARTVLGELRRHSAAAKAIKADLAQVAEIRRLFKTVGRSFKELDLLVNNAGVFSTVRFDRLTETEWDRVHALNVKAAAFCSQEAVKLMRRGGAIINIASLGGIQAWAGHPAYSASKAGLLMLTRVLAKALAPGIRVNAIAPGVIDMPGERGGARPEFTPDRIPLKKYGSARDITSAVIFLARDARYVTGQVIVVDGGRAA
jgi:pteridine reductase